MTRKRTVILISGRGSNMAALIEASREADYPAEIVGVIANRADAKGLEAAAALGVATKTVPQGDFEGREAHDDALDAALNEFRADLVCLAGYMRLLTPGFVDAWQGRMINIHPSLLPAFKGLDTHARALAAGMRVHGCSVHFVTHDVDAGPIIAQAAMPVLPADTAESLAARVLKAEHKLYPLALALVAGEKAQLEGGRVRLTGVEMPASHAGAVLLSPSSWHGERDIEDLARFTP